MVMRINGGIINDQTLTGGLRFFKIVGPFAWTVSAGTVNLPFSVVGGDPTVTSYFVVGAAEVPAPVPPATSPAYAPAIVRPVPNSAAELVLREISKQADIVLIGLYPDQFGGTTELHIALSASALGWGSNEPPYDLPPADADEINLPALATAGITPAATQMQTAIQALADATVYITVGSQDPLLAPVPTTVSFAGVTVTEVSFSLGDLTYYTLR